MKNSKGAQSSKPNPQVIVTSETGDSPKHVKNSSTRSQRNTLHLPPLSTTTATSNLDSFSSKTDHSSDDMIPLNDENYYVYPPRNELFHELDVDRASSSSNPSSFSISHVELSQKQAMRLDGNGVLRLTNGVVYTLTCQNRPTSSDSKSTKLIPIAAGKYVISVKLGYIPLTSNDETSTTIDDDGDVSPMPNHTSYSDSSNEHPSTTAGITWLTFNNDLKPLNHFSVKTSDQNTALKIGIAVAKFSDVKKMATQMPSAKKVLFVFVFRVSGWNGDIRVFFKYSTRSKSEIAHSWQLEKTLHASSHSHVVELRDFNCPINYQQRRQRDFQNFLAKINSSQHLSPHVNTATPSPTREDVSPNQSPVSPQTSPGQYLATQGQTSNFFRQQIPKEMHSAPSMQQAYPQHLQLLNAFQSYHNTLNPSLTPNQFLQSSYLMNNAGSNNANRAGYLDPHSFLFNNDHSANMEQRNTSRKRKREDVQSRPSSKSPSPARKPLSIHINSIGPSNEGPCDAYHYRSLNGRFIGLEQHLDSVRIYFGSKRAEISSILSEDIIQVSVPQHDPTPEPLNVTILVRNEDDEWLPLPSSLQYRFIVEDDSTPPSKNQMTPLDAGGWFTSETPDESAHTRDKLPSRSVDDSNGGTGTSVNASRTSGGDMFLVDSDYFDDEFS